MAKRTDLPVTAVSPRFFATLGVPILAGRDFTDEDRDDTELVAIVSQSVAQRLFPNGDAVNRRLWFANRGKPRARRIVGIVADVDDENVVQEPTLTVYHPLRQMGLPSRLFVRVEGDPYALVPSATHTIREISAHQAVERPTTLEDVRAEVLTPERLNAFVFSAFGGIALLIAVVGVAGVLAFSVSARTREFGVRMAIGSTPSQLLTRVLKEGAVIVAAGITAGAVLGYAMARVASAYLETTRMPGVLPAVGAAAVLTGAAVIASLIPAARASRVDVIQALRSE
jgi:hypothetical protein